MVAKTGMETGVVHLAVEKRTGTQGDDLVAWGLAIVASEVIGGAASLTDNGDCYTVDVKPGEPLQERLENFTPTNRTRLAWLASTGKGRKAPPNVWAIDRDAGRDAYKTWRQTAHLSSATGASVVAEGPLVVADFPVRHFPLYAVLTNPGTQWAGYNKLVEATEKLLTSGFPELLLKAYDARSPLSDVDVAKLLAQGGLRKGEIRRNPPGFLYPGLNKGPTMRLVAGDGVAVGKTNLLDWMQVDRGDRTLLELYLAYVGYFAVARVLDYNGGRMVIVPSPWRVQVPIVLDVIDHLDLRSSTITPYLTAQAALRYAQAAIRYWRRVVEGAPAAAKPTGTVFNGIHLAHFWKPSQNTYAPQTLDRAPLPSWVWLMLQAEGFDVTDATIEQHSRQLGSMRGRFDEERKLSGERRAAIEGYADALDGKATTWLDAVSRWCPAVLAESTKVGARTPALWTIADVRRIAVTLEARLSEILDDEAFQRLARAIRSAVVHSHFARREGKRSRQAGEGAGGRGSVFDPQYDLVGTLAEAAKRHPDEFLREMCYFVATYNEETMRRSNSKDPKGMRAMVRAGDLEKLTQWVQSDRRGVVPAALLAFGTSLVGKPSETKPIGEGANADSDLEALEAELIGSTDSAEEEDE